MTLSLWLLACERERLDAELLPSEWTPAVGRIEWDGPAGRATLSIDGGRLDRRRVVAEAEVEDGPSALPLGGIPPGRWRWRLELDDGQRIRATADQPFEVPPPPEELGALALLASDPDRSRLARSGYWLGHSFGGRWHPEDAIPFAVDGRGEVVWWLPPDPEGGRAIRVKPGLDGRSVLVLDDFEDGGRRALHRYALDGSSRISTPLPDATHDFWENGDGTVTYLSYVLSDTERMPGQPSPVAADRLRTVTEGDASGSGAEEGFDLFEDFPRDPWYPCAHGVYDSFVPEAAEWSHVNSLIRSPRDDGWLLMARYFDALLAVDGHQRLWQAGGADGTLEPTDPRAVFLHAHASHAWLGDDGRIHLLMMDNRNHTRPPIVSRALEIAIDPEEGTYAPIWEVPDPERRLTGFLGDARRLPNGNTLVAWSGGRLIEFGPEGDPVWRLQRDGPLGRGFWIPELDLGP